MLLTNFWLSFSRVFILMCLVNILIVFGGVAFYTLLERKVLSYSQNRKGPKKVSFLGLLQPISDAIKLILKSYMKPHEVKLSEFLGFPFMALLLMVLFWLNFYPSFSYYKKSLSMLFVFLVLSLGVYPILGSGWSSKSKYGVLGSVRGAAQSMSYEVVLIFMFLWVLFFFLEPTFYISGVAQMGVFLFSIFFLWVMVIMCDTNRAPFDFAEGESELVSGFKMEYGSFPFALLFLAEYGVILFLSVLSGFYFFSGSLSVFFSFFVSMLFLWVRSSFPRFRFDLLMSFCWQILLMMVFFIYFLMLFI